MNGFLAKFSDFNSTYEKQLDQFKKSLRKKKPIKKRKIKKPEINHAKGLSYLEFLETKYWENVRKKVFARDNNQCVICHTSKNLRVHHETYKNHGFEHTHLEDLTTLCNDCHRIRHGILDFVIE
jgi:nitrate/TMAO reductase-like tetraheme cytochrome c subunit